MKNIPYFQHDKDMRNDPKIIALRSNFGAAGYSVYCFTLEALTDSKDNILQIDNINLEILSGDFRIKASELLEIYQYCFKLNLFQLLEEDKLICEELNRRLSPLLEKREKWRNNWQNRKKNGNSQESFENSQRVFETLEESPTKDKDKDKGKGKEESNNTRVEATNINLEIPDEIHKIWHKSYGRNCNFNEYEFTTKLIKIAGILETERHIRDLSKNGFKKLKTMEESTISYEEIQTDGTTKILLKIKPKDNENGNTGKRNTTVFQQRVNWQYDEQRINETLQYLQSSD